MEDVHTCVVTLWAAISAHAGMVIYWTLTEPVAMVSKRKDDGLYGSIYNAILSSLLSDLCFACTLLQSVHMQFIVLG